MPTAPAPPAEPPPRRPQPLGGEARVCAYVMRKSSGRRPGVKGGVGPTSARAEIGRDLDNTDRVGLG